MGQDEKKGVGKRGGGKRGGLHQVVITREQFPKLSLSCLILDSWCLPLIYVRFRFFELSELDLVILLPQFKLERYSLFSHLDLRRTITTDQTRH